VLADDLMTAPAPRLRELKVLRTYIGGERVY
jgi:hypothetical protein